MGKDITNVGRFNITSSMFIGGNLIRIGANTIEVPLEKKSQDM